MAKLSDLSIINSNTAESEAVESGTEKTLCSPSLCGSKNLTVYRRTVAQGRKFDLQAGNDYHLVYIMRTPSKGSVHYRNEVHEAEEGAGVLLRPSETAQFEASGSDMEMLHMVVANPPAAGEGGLS